MRMITATTAFVMPHLGINLTLSAFSISSTVFRNSEKLSCANEVSASKQNESTSLYLSNKGWIQSCQSLSGHQIHSFSDFQAVGSFCLKKLHQINFTAAKPSNRFQRLFVLQERVL